MKKLITMAFLIALASFLMTGCTKKEKMASISNNEAIAKSSITKVLAYKHDFALNWDNRANVAFPSEAFVDTELADAAKFEFAYVSRYEGTTRYEQNLEFGEVVQTENGELRIEVTEGANLEGGDYKMASWKVKYYFTFNTEKATPVITKIEELLVGLPVESSYKSENVLTFMARKSEQAALAIGNEDTRLRLEMREILEKVFAGELDATGEEKAFVDFTVRNKIDTTPATVSNRAQPTLNSANAASYATTYNNTCGCSTNFSGYNTAYKNYASLGGDCANFVSQCLKYGGWVFETAWKYLNQGTSTTTDDNATSAWVGADALFNYVKGYGVLRTPSSFYGSSTTGGMGDIAGFSNSAGAAKYHVMICSYKSGTTKYFSGHTNNRINYSIGSASTSSATLNFVDIP